jgi:DNA primase
MEFADQLKTQVDIVRVVSEYVPALRKQGTRFVAPCPFHQEKTPSFGVHPVHQFYKCFGCGAGGDVIKFVMEIEGLTFWEALTQLAERHGIPLPKRSEHADEETRMRAALFEMHDLALQSFRKSLDSAQGEAAREYIRKRGIAAATVIEFGLGFAERSGQALTRLFQQRRFSAEQMEASGLVLRRQDGSGWFDRFRGRLIFPIHNETGKVIAFAGRAMSADDEPKYLNSSETPIYRKSHVLYNLHRARRPVRQNDRSILVEGYMDVIGLYQAGVQEAIASCGTALTDNQVRVLRRHSERIVVNFDPDEAGTKAALRSVQMLLEEGMHIRVLELLGGLDPDDYVKEHGAEAYLSGLADAPDCFHWLADRARKQFDMSSADGRVEGFRQILLPAIQRIPKKLDCATVAEEVAQYLRVDPSLVRNEFKRLGGGREQQQSQPNGHETIHPKEKVLVNLLLRSEAARREVIPRLRELCALQQFQMWPILRVMLELEEREAVWGYEDVAAGLEEGEKTLLASVAFADALDIEEASLEQALAFLPELERKEREAGIADIKARIRDAEQNGNFAEAMVLMEELNTASSD